MVPHITVKNLDEMTQFAPLVALGCYIRDSDLLSPVISRLCFTQATHTEHPVEALIDLWVSILAGCRTVRQINTRIRPDLVLAQAWDRKQFAEQSTIARVLDVCQPAQVAQFRSGANQIYRWLGQAPHHRLGDQPLMIDIDLTGLRAGRQAEGSTPGYFPEKRGRPVDNYVESAQQTTKKPSAPCSIRATP